MLKKKKEYFYPARRHNIYPKK